MVPTGLIFPYVNVAENIRKFRKAMGLTQVLLAEKLGTTQHVITNYERGLRNPAAAKMPEIARALGVTLEELYGLEGKTAEKRSPRKAPNRRLTQMQNIFEDLPSTDQRALLKQAKALRAQKSSPSNKKTA
jgi:transcriptional regulator with XRE-family HTH domain